MGAVLSKIPATPWVLNTISKMDDLGLDDKRNWNKYWLKTYDELGGKSYESGNFDLDELDNDLDKGIQMLGILTIEGFKTWEGLPIDLWKTRFWVLLEKAGLLPELEEWEKDKLF